MPLGSRLVRCVRVHAYVSDLRFQGEGSVRTAQCGRDPGSTRRARGYHYRRQTRASMHRPGVVPDAITPYLLIDTEGAAAGGYGRMPGRGLGRRCSS